MGKTECLGSVLDLISGVSGDPPNSGCLVRTLKGYPQNSRCYGSCYSFKPVFFLNNPKPKNALSQFRGLVPLQCAVF